MYDNVYVVVTAVLASASVFLGVLLYHAAKDIVTEAVTGTKTQDNIGLTEAGKAAANTFCSF